MSDYPNPNIHRGDGVSGHGLLISFAVIVAVVALLALLGSVGSGGREGAPTPDAIAPTAIDSTGAAGMAVPTE
ncbi:hypothetical protein [Tateyamaria sp. ANG-S1]|uniref:hypothetical protein n=1 Tax=Tateyamaria sp. ANG-S1 TaxID=1577905 RepID=UPI00057D97CD|nr:hypothetical protein [Tateyamaria sp. ANG-S1]KIC51315.1 hypothetical protein RA29_05685 [Tateyamaria sp. ANG-S1]